MILGKGSGESGAGERERAGNSFLPLIYIADIYAILNIQWRGPRKATYRIFVGFLAAGVPRIELVEIQAR